MFQIDPFAWRSYIIYTIFRYIFKNFIAFNGDYSVLKRQEERFMSFPILAIIKYFFQFRIHSIFQGKSEFQSFSKQSPGSPLECFRNPFYSINFSTEKISVLHYRVLFSDLCWDLFHYFHFFELNSNFHSGFFHFASWASLSHSNKHW